MEKENRPRRPQSSGSIREDEVYRDIRDAAYDDDDDDGDGDDGAGTSPSQRSPSPPRQVLLNSSPEPSKDEWRATLAEMRQSVMNLQPPRRNTPLPSEKKIKGRKKRVKENVSVGTITRGDCPLTLRLHLSRDSMDNELRNSRKHKKYVESCKPGIDCAPPKHALKFAKRMRARKQAMPNIDLPLSLKNRSSALSLWTMMTQVKADNKMIREAKHRIDSSKPKAALHFSKWKKKQRVSAEKEQGMRGNKDKNTGGMRSPSVSRSRPGTAMTRRSTPVGASPGYRTGWRGLKHEEPPSLSRRVDFEESDSHSYIDDGMSLGDSELLDGFDDIYEGGELPGSSWLGAPPNTMRPLSSTSMRNRRNQRPSSALGARGGVKRPQTAPGIRVRGGNKEVYDLTEERFRQSVVAECERLTGTPEGSVANDQYTNQDISSAVSDTEGSSWAGSKELYLRLLNEDVM